MPYRDPEKSRLRAAAWREKNKDRHRQYCRDYYRLKHGLPTSESYKPRVPLNPEERKQRNRENNARLARITKEYIWSYKQDHPCKKCGETDPACLVFHHRKSEEKDNNISSMTSLRAAKAEIEKCDVLCANCHMKLHYNLQKTRR